MGRIKVIELSEHQRQELEREYREGKTHSYRQRCKGVLLKSQKRSSAEVAEQLECNEITVNIWLKRYEEGGIKGLKMLSGRGRKPILDEADLEKVKEVVAEHRQKRGYQEFYVPSLSRSLAPKSWANQLRALRQSLIGMVHFFDACMIAK